MQTYPILEFCTIMQNSVSEKRDVQFQGRERGKRRTVQKNVSKFRLGDFKIKNQIY